MVLRRNRRLWNRRSFRHRLQGFILIRWLGGQGSVVHAGDICHSSHHIWQYVCLFHPLTYCAGDIFREKRRRVTRLKKFLYRIRAGPANVDLEAL